MKLKNYHRPIQFVSCLLYLRKELYYMLALKRNKKHADLKIEGYKLRGRSSNEMLAYTDKDIYLFSNDQKVGDSTYLRIHFFNLLKNLKICDIPSAAQFGIVQVGANDPLPEPVNRLPFPFRYIVLGKRSDGEFIIRVDVATDIDLYEEWDQKWNAQHFFNSLIDLKLEQGQNVSVREIINEKLNSHLGQYLEIEIAISDEQMTIDHAVDLAIEQLNAKIKKVEIKLSGLDSIFRAIDTFEQNLENGNEKFWQKVLKEHSQLIANCFSLPVMLFHNEAYLGGKSIGNREGRLIDFLYRNKLTNNLCLIEIKTPVTKIIGKQYRNVYSLSHEFTGAVCQLLDYRDNLLNEYYSLSEKSDEKFIANNPQLLLIVGKADALSIAEKKTLESFRQDLKSIQIITFDELLEKIRMILKIISHDI